jgi:hypothetical protein
VDEFEDYLETDSEDNSPMNPMKWAFSAPRSGLITRRSFRTRRGTEHDCHCPVQAVYAIRPFEQGVRNFVSKQRTACQCAEGKLHFQCDCADVQVVLSLSTTAGGGSGAAGPDFRAVFHLPIGAEKSRGWGLTICKNNFVTHGGTIQAEKYLRRADGHKQSSTADRLNIWADSAVIKYI